jgi:predicted MFS family arabinose efflux permease
VISPALFAKFKAKHILITAAICNGLSVVVFSFIKIYWVIFASRVLAGFFQVAFVIYFPVWIDLCSPPEKQTMWISFFFLTVPIGIIVGYAITIGVSNFTEYKYSFIA